jgi:hypothetical protein
LKVSNWLVRVGILKTSERMDPHQLSFQKLISSPFPRSQIEFSKIVFISSLILLHREEYM